MAATRRPTRNDVARQAGVSGWTVSQVLNGRTNVSIAETTRARVLAAAEKIGYRPNHTARSLATGSTHIVSVWAGCLSPFYATVVTHIRAQARPRGFRILISDIEEVSSITSPGTQDGIIAIEYPERADVYLATHPESRTPLVSVGAHFLAHADHVGVDLYAGACEAVEHLLAMGVRRLAMVRPALPASQTEPRASAYDAAMERAARAPEHIVTGAARADARSAIREYVARYGCPDGLFCHNDDLAIGVYRGLRDLGIRVPEQVALVGCDGIEAAEYLDCPLTTIEQPVERMCALAWQFLERRMADPAIDAQQVLLSPRLVVRDSSRRS